MTPPRESAPPEAPPGGPYLSAALLCEKVLREGDGVLSIIRIVDRLIQSAVVGPDEPEEMPPFPVNLTVVLVLKSGSARGRHSVRVTVEAPSGELMPQEASLPVLLEGEERGVNLLLNLGFMAEHEGLYWFNVYFGTQDVLLTRIPLRVIYQPQRLGASAEPAE
jgi:hypothetical protein